MPSGDPQPFKLNAASGALVCQDAQLLGDITIGAGTIVHIAAKILAENGPIVIGENCLIEEHVTICNRHEKGTTMTIGDGNMFEVGSHIECLKIGDKNLIETRARLGRDCILGDHSVVTVKATVDGAETIPNVCIVSVDGGRRIAESDPFMPSAQMEVLRKLLPNYQAMSYPPPPAHTKS